MRDHSSHRTLGCATNTLPVHAPTTCVRQMGPQTDAVAAVLSIEASRRTSFCPATWTEMSGTNRFRLCEQGKHYVYDFNGMSRKEAECLVFTREGTEGTINFSKRSDGRYVTRDCPVGVKLRKQRLGAAIAVLTVVIAACCLASFSRHCVDSGTTTNVPGGFVIPRAHEPLFTIGGTKGSNPAMPVGSLPGSAVNAGRSSRMAALAIPAGARYVTKYTRLEFLPNAPTVAVKLPLPKAHGARLK